MELDLFTAAISIGTLVTLLLSILSFIRTNKNDATILISKMSVIEQRVESMGQLVNAISVAEIASMKQSLSDLRSRVDKLDGDMEKKIDQLSDKLDRLLQVVLNFTSNTKQNV